MNSSSVFPKSVDGIVLSKAELVVKNLSLKVDATAYSPYSALALYNAVTGQFLGNMTFAGLTGPASKYSFQGTIPAAVTTLRIQSVFNASITGAVAQK